MPFQKEFQFPSEEDLNIREVNLSISALRAGSIHLGKYCEKQNNEFIMCREDELGDPRKCLAEGKAVTNCALDFFSKIKKHCCAEFNQYADCLFRSSGDMGFKHCRKTQAVFDKCVLDELNWERPPFGWQAEVHIHQSKRPKPNRDLPEYPDAPDSLPLDEIKLEDPKYGFRKFMPN